MACFRVDYCGRGELADRQQKLNQMMSKLTHMAEEFNVAVFMTNQVQSDPGASALFAGADGRKPVGGHILGERCPRLEVLATRLMQLCCSSCKPNEDTAGKPHCVAGKGIWY